MGSLLCCLVKKIPDVEIKTDVRGNRCCPDDECPSSCCVFSKTIIIRSSTAKITRARSF